jgi:hypothetical protein
MGQLLATCPADIWQTRGSIPLVAGTQNWTEETCPRNP